VINYLFLSHNININVKRKLNFTLGCSKAGIVDFKRDPLFSHLTPSDIRTIVKSPLQQINEPLKPCRFKPPLNSSTFCLSWLAFTHQTATLHNVQLENFY